MESVTIREVQHNLAAYLKRVEAGEDIVIRRRNKIVARLVAAGEYGLAAPDPGWSRVRERREAAWGGKPAGGTPGSDMVRESRGER